MRRILPKIVHDAVLDFGQRNAIVRVQHLQDGVVIRDILRIGFELGKRLLVLRLGPGERLWAVNVGEPQPRIGGIRRQGRGALGRGESNQ